MQTQALQTKPDYAKIRKDFLGIRTNCLRECLESFLQFLSHPSTESYAAWNACETDFIVLTGGSPIDRARHFIPDTIPTKKKDAKIMREEWCQLIVSLMELDQQLGKGSDFLSRYYAISPFKRLLLVIARPRMGPYGREKMEAALYQMARKGGVASGTKPVFNYHSTFWFMVFRLPRTKKPQLLVLTA